MMSSVDPDDEPKVYRNAQYWEIVARGLQRTIDGLEKRCDRLLLELTKWENAHAPSPAEIEAAAREIELERGHLRRVK